jgi:riboflavin kinase/FMN adenylyltransferase
MRLFCGLAGIPADLGPTVVTVGMFDGVHRGHQALLRRVTEEAAARGLPPGVVTFDRHPMRVLRPGSDPPLLTSLRQRIALLGRFGMDFALLLPFTLELSRVPAERFAAETLFDGVGAAAVVVGGNFRFGHRASGDPALLAELGGRRGVDVVALGLHAQDGDGEPASSTRVRAALAAGDVAAAGRLLGRPHVVEGHVVPGDRRGRQLGLPTANLAVPARIVLPAAGVYAGHLEPEGRGGAPEGRGASPPLPAVTSVGVNPQFGGEPRVESHLLDFDGDLYGRRVAVSFEHRVSDNAAFPTVEELLAKIREDLRVARRLLAGPPPP